MGKVKDLIDNFKDIWTSDDIGPIQTMSSTYGIGNTQPIQPLSSEEALELYELSKKHKEELRLAKLNFFKKLPKELRQHAITHYTWIESIKNIDSVQLPVNTRIAELQAKDYNHAALALNNHNYHKNFYNSFSEKLIPSYIPMPQDLTLRELIAAHLEASIEEELIDGV
jgi:hypothetical protein